LVATVTSDYTDCFGVILYLLSDYTVADFLYIINAIYTVYKYSY